MKEAFHRIYDNGYAFFNTIFIKIYHIILTRQPLFHVAPGWLSAKEKLVLPPVF